MCTQTHWRALLPQLATILPAKVTNLPPPANGPIHTESRILKHVVASASESEVWGLLHYGHTAVPFRINLNKLGFPQSPNQIKTDISASEGIVTTTVRQKRSKAIDMRFYGMKLRGKQNDFFV